jgi:FKBP-type peptidyl-prolyl cis-trans isomerase
MTAVTVTPEQLQAVLDKVAQVQADLASATAATQFSHEADTAVTQAQAAVADAQAVAAQKKLEEAAADSRVNLDVSELQALVVGLAPTPAPPEPTP